MLVSEVDGYLVKIYDVLNEQIMWQLEHDAELISVDFRKDGMLCVTVCVDRSIRVWDLNTGLLDRKINGGIMRTVTANDVILVYTWFKT